MFSRRYLRRSLVAALLLPIIVLSLFAIYQNRDVIFSDHSSHDHHHDHHHSNDDPHFSNDKRPYENLRNRFRLKYESTTSNIPSAVNIKEDQQIKSSSSTIQPLTVLNNIQRVQFYNPIQQNIPRQAQSNILPVIETKNLQSFVHLDLKGAAPKVTYYEKLFPYLKQLGATGLLIEYEDMFPFTDSLSVVKHGLAYSKNDVETILELAEKNNLQVMPLLQVYGHLEYVLKLKEFMHLREDKRYPQVITPCLEESYKLIFEMIDQMLSLHRTIPYLHIGCDEVYYRLVHPQCVNLQFRDEGDLFIRHVTRIAKYIKSKRPNVKLFIWHDMVSQLFGAGNNNITELIELVVPMVWAYVDDIKTWFDDSFWMRFAVFPELWVASTYKGSSGETTTMSYIGHHQRNQQTWLEAMYIGATRHKVNFTGVAVTGWSRYDHMLSLCEFIPSSIPSLTYALQTIVHGHITNELNETISRTVLGCNQMPLWERSAYPTFVQCSFPGHELYEMMYQHDTIMRQYDEAMAFVRLYVTDIHVRQNYIHYKRGEECLERLYSVESQMIHFIDAFQNACSKFFTADIGPEWLQTYFMRSFKEVQQRMNFIQRSLKTQSSWSQRPLPNNTARIVITKRNITFSNQFRNF